MLIKSMVELKMYHNLSKYTWQTRPNFLDFLLMTHES